MIIIIVAENCKEFKQNYPIHYQLQQVTKENSELYWEEWNLKYKFKRLSKVVFKGQISKI